MRCFYDGLANVTKCRGAVAPNPASPYRGHVAFDSAAGCCSAHRAEAKTRAANAGDDVRGFRETA